MYQLNRQYPPSGRPVLAKPLTLDTPAHIQHLQAAIHEHDAALLRESHTAPYLVRQQIPGEWWPWAVYDGDYTQISLTHSGGIGKIALSNPGTRYQRILGSEEWRSTIIHAISYLDVRDGELRNLDDWDKYRNLWWDFTEASAEGAEMDALLTARRVWRDAEILSAASLREYVKYAPLVAHMGVR